MNILYYGGGVEVYCGSSASMFRNFFLLFSSLLYSKLFISTLLRKQIRAQCKLRGEDQILLMQAPIQEVDLAPQHGIDQWESDPDDLAIGRINGVQQNDSTWWSFISFAAGSVRNLPPTQHKFLLMLFVGILSVLTRTCATQFFESFQVGKITYTYTPEELFYAFFLEVAHITCFIVCWIITLILIYPLQHVLLLFFGLLCSAIIYFVKLKEKTSTSGVHVACGDSFNLPLYWFAIIHAVGFYVIFWLMVFLIAYLSWEFIYKGNLRASEAVWFYVIIGLMIFIYKGKLTYLKAAVIIQLLTFLLLTFVTVLHLAMSWLNDSTSGVYKASGRLFELPLFWFASLEAVGFSVIIGLVILLIAYLGWRFIHLL